MMRILRQRAGLNRTELARRARITLRTVQLIESGRRLPSLPILARLRGALGCNTDELINNLLANYVGPGVRHPKYQRTHCRNGHEYTPENTLVDARSGTRRCVACLTSRTVAKAREQLGA